METLEVELKPVVQEPITEPVPVEVETPEPEAVVLEQTPAEVKVEVAAPVTEEALVVETPPAEPAVVEAEIVEEAEPIIPETEPETEVRLFKSIITNGFLLDQPSKPTYQSRVPL